MLNAMVVVIPGRAPIINGIAIVTVNSLHCGVTYKITAQGMYNNGTLVGPGSSYGPITTGVCPMTTSKNAHNCACIIRTQSYVRMSIPTL